MQNHPPDTKLESNHAYPETPLSTIDRRGTSERDRRRARDRSIRSRSIATPCKAQAVCNVKKDIDVAIDTSEELLARTHSEDGDVGQRVDTLILAPIYC